MGRMTMTTRNAIHWAILLVVACTVNVAVASALGHGAGAWLVAMATGVAAAMAVGAPLERRLARDA
jgi:hypothetical protein